MEGQLDRSSPFNVAMQDTCGTATIPLWGGPSGDWPLVAGLEPVLGEDFAPDAHFFVESWTYGVTAAAKNLRLRQQALKDRAQQKSSWQDFDSFIPRFSAEEFLMEHQRARDVKTPSSPGAGTRGAALEETEELPRNCEGDYETSDLLTVQQARCLLGVEVGSSMRQIKTAYRRLVRLNHPDCLAGASVQAKQIATERTIQINEAYHLLCGSRLGEPA
jgi:DnaJ-domain-containing protein 1